MLNLSRNFCIPGYLILEATAVDKSFEMFIDKDLEDIVDELNAAGLTVDLDKLDRHIQEFKKKEEDANRSFKDSAAKRGYNINIRSRKELTQWFFETLGLLVYKRGKTGPSLDAESLEMLAHKEETAAFYLWSKQAHSMVTTLTNIKKAVRDGKIYPQHNLNKAASGRFSSSGKNGDKLNINGWPKSIRDILKSAEGTVIVSFDYRNMEGHVSAALAKEDSLLRDMENSVDLHQQLADVLGVPRKIAKIVTHGTSYGMTAYGLARKIGCTEQEAEEFIEKYWETRPRIRNLKRDVIRTARMMGEVVTIAGFRRQVKGLSPDQIWSSFVQGSAADIFKEALARVSKYLKRTGKGRVQTPMHDALICELSTQDLDTTIDEIRHLMETAHPEIHLKVDIQMDKW